MADIDATLGPAVSVRWRMLGGLGLGAAMALGTPPYDAWPVTLAALVLVFAAMRAAPRGAGRFGWAVGLGYFGLGLSWIVEPFFVEPEIYGWMAPFALAGIAGGLALFWVAAFALAGRSRRPLTALVLAWTGAELLRAYVLTGFPWSLPGYVWLDTPAAQWASVIGPHGLTLATLALPALVVGALPGRPALLRASGATGAAALAGVLWAGGAWLTPPPQDLSGRPVVRLVQPNAPQDEKWDPERWRIFYDRQLDFTAAPPSGPNRAPSLVIWPETALPMLLRNADGAFAAMSDASAGVPVATGINRVEDGLWYNTLVVIRDGAVTQTYDKTHLVPFGEYMPFPGLVARLGISALAARATGGFAPGEGAVPIALDGLGTALPLICYEAVFPQRITGAGFRPDWLMHVTNDAWFGTWSGPYQHLAQARIRAIEQGLPLLRAANTGVSAAIDGAGRVIASLELGQAGYLDVPLPPPLRVTPYSRTGDWPVALLLLGSLAALLFPRRRETD